MIFLSDPFYQGKVEIDTYTVNFILFHVKLIEGSVSKVGVNWSQPDEEKG